MKNYMDCNQKFLGHGDDMNFQQPRPGLLTVPYLYFTVQRAPKLKRARGVQGPAHNKFKS